MTEEKMPKLDGKIAVIPEFPPVITAIFPSSFGIFSSVMSVEPRSFPGRIAFGLAPRLIQRNSPPVCLRV
jgi:hypothetical protein